MVFPVVVSAGSARAGVRGILGDSLKVSVRAAPERGRANAELAQVLAEFLGVPRARVTIEAGQGGRRKRIKVAGLGARAVLERIEGRDAGG